MTTDEDNNEEELQLADELYGISARALLHQLKTSKILKANEQLKQQNRALDEELLTDKQALKEVEYYADALGNPSIIDNILMGGIEGSTALKHELVEIAALRRAGWDIYNHNDIEAISLRFEQAIKLHQPQQYIPFHLEALEAELVYAHEKLRSKGIEAALGMIAKALYRLDLEEQDFDIELTEKLDKTVTELEALNINYSFNEPIPKELKNAL
jgi:hypothetical protein